MLSKCMYEWRHMLFSIQSRCSNYHDNNSFANGSSNLRKHYFNFYGVHVQTFETVIFPCSSHVNHNFQARDVKFIALNQFKIGIIYAVFTTKEICIFVKMVANVCLFQTERVKGKRFFQNNNCFLDKNCFQFKN